MKKTLLLVITFLLSLAAFSQKVYHKKNGTPVVKEDRSITKADLQRLTFIEDTLQALSRGFTYDSVLDSRKKSCYSFIPRFVNALKVRNSFYHPFDSLETVSRIYAPDSSFRIFTWQLVLPGGKFRYYGLLQMRSSVLKMYPLFDGSDTMTYHSQRVSTKDDWYGALYYNATLNMAGKKAYYTLFGYEAADYITRRKVVDVLWFEADGSPRFGAPLFHFTRPEDSTHYAKADTLHRFFIEYKYSASTVLNYDRDLQMIVFDHVTPPVEKARGATFTYIPDGTYEGFKWTGDKWSWVETVFNFSINEMDNPPIPAPLFGIPARQPDLPKEGPK